MKNFLIVASLLILVCSCSPKANTSVNTTPQPTAAAQLPGLTQNQIWHRNHKIMISANEKACSVTSKLRDAIQVCSPLVYIRGELPDEIEERIKRVIDGVYQDMYSTESIIESFKLADPKCSMIKKIDYYLPTAKKNTKILVDRFYTEHDQDRYVNLCNRVKTYGFMDSFNGICNETNPNMYPIP